MIHSKHASWDPPFMDWQRYKTICDSPGVCSRWLLEQSAELVDEPRLAGRLQDQLQQTPVAKPDDHEGSIETDMFRMSLTLDEVRRVRGCVEAAAAAGATTSATRGRGLGGFVETWREYERHLERGAGGYPGGGSGLVR